MKIGPSTAEDLRLSLSNMKNELSIFVDESGDFGKYQKYCPYYLITFVIHNQKDSINKNIEKLNSAISYFHLPENYIHAGPIIRQEDYFYSFSLKDRRKMLNIGINFVRTLPIKYHTFIIHRSKYPDAISETSALSKDIHDYLTKHFSDFSKFKCVKVYYDKGQREVTKILASVMPISIPCKVIFKEVHAHDEYKLFQACDIICALELINEKLKQKVFSKTETVFFKTKSQFLTDYYKKISKKNLD